MNKTDLNEIAIQILRSRKYRNLGIPVETVIDLLLREFEHTHDQKTALKATRKKLHNIIALYLGDPDYDQSLADLTEAKQSNDALKLKGTCRQILFQHSTTQERLSILDHFYADIFKVTGNPSSILDLACGLNPLTLPWMGLPLSIRYHAFDIHTERVHFINNFLTLYGMAALAEVRDVLINPPIIHADLAFFFKEAHRLEQRRKGANRDLWQSVDVDWLIISLPIYSLSGQHNLTQHMRHLVYETLHGLPWQVQEIEFENELVFCIKK